MDDNNHDKITAEMRAEVIRIMQDEELSQQFLFFYGPTGNVPGLIGSSDPMFAAICGTMATRQAHRGLPG